MLRILLEILELELLSVDLLSRPLHAPYRGAQVAVQVRIYVRVQLIVQVLLLHAHSGWSTLHFNF